MKSIRRSYIEVQSPWTAIREITRQKFVLAASFLLLLSFTSLYLITSPPLASQPWDSLEYAYAAEVDGPSRIWGNHPLGHIIFSLAVNLAKQLGYQGRAISILQTTNSLISGLTVAIFFVVLYSIVKVRPLYALGFSLIFGASNSFRFFAGTGDIYQISILFALLGWASLVSEVTSRGRTFPLFSGIFTGLAILSHQLNIVLIPVGLALILLNPHSGDQVKKEKIKQAAHFISVSLTVAALGYLSLGFIATSSFSLVKVIGWMRGYFGDPTYGRSINAEVLKTAWITISEAVLFFPRENTQFIRQTILFCISSMALIGLWLIRTLDGRKRAILAASALACILTWPLILWWEPQNQKFWLLTLPHWMMLLALSFEAVETGLRERWSEAGSMMSQAVQALSLIIGIALLWINTQPIDPKKDVAFDQAMTLWLDHSSPDDVLVTAGDMIPQLRYLGKRPNTLFLYRSLQKSQTSTDHFYDLRTKIDQALCSNHTVLITPVASEYVDERELSLVGVTREELRLFLNETVRQGDILFWYRNTWDGKILPVYALNQPVACMDQKSRPD